MDVKNGTILYDKVDQHIVDLYKWHINDQGYAIWRGVEDGEKKTIRLHRLIAKTPHGMVTDHINHVRHDNRRKNLRVCTQSENMRNLKRQGKGYWYNNGRTSRPYVVEVYGVHRGCFATEEEAAEFVKLVRSGKEYKKEKIERKECKYGHSLDDAYIINGMKMCKKCQSERSRKYYVRKTKR